MLILGGFFVPVLGLLGMIVFSISLFFNVGLIMIWLYLELCGLCLIPLFFSGGFCLSLSGLFYYVVFSGVSSCLLLIGFLIPEGLYFLLGGFMIKFGIFPFWGWVYRVCCSSGWLVVWGFSTILKISFVLFPLFMILSLAVTHGLILLCSIGCVFLSFLFWFYVYDWKVCWCHIMLSSSSVLVGLSISGCSLISLLAVFCVYFFWSTFVLLYFSYYGEGGDIVNGGFSMFLFSFLLLTLPVSLSIFYKILVCSCIFTSGLILLLCWVLYSFSEQLYLFLFITGLFSGKSYIGSLELV